MIRPVVKAFLDFLYPPVCLFCDGLGAEEGLVCPGCLDLLRASCRPSVLRGGRGFPRLSCPVLVEGAVTFWDYSQGMENLIHRIKYGRGRRTCMLLGGLAGEALFRMRGSGKRIPWDRDPDKGAVLFIPVPLHGVKRRERGYNQSEWICEALSASFPLEWNGGILERLRNTKSQTRLSARQRQDNVGDAFKAADGETLEGRTVCLVDDVITTGATVNACARSLLDAGAASVWALALARPEMED